MYIYAVLEHLLNAHWLSYATLIHVATHVDWSVDPDVVYGEAFSFNFKEHEDMGFTRL